MIAYKTGNLLDDDAEVLVNPVNCVGVMGAGLAKQFKERFPAYFADYAAKCKKGEIQIGWANTYDCLRAGGRPLRIISFPTKYHWKSKSRLEEIYMAMCDIQDCLKGRKSVAFPALGCGLGGLSWADVKPLMEDHLSNLDADVRIYLPKES